MNNMFDIRVEGRKFRTFEGDLYLTVINFGKEVNIPLRERTKKRIEKLNPEKIEKDGYIVITDPKAVIIAAKDVGMLRKARNIVAAGAATVTLSAGLLSYLNLTNASQIDNKNEKPIETTQSSEEETKIVRDDAYYLSLAHGEIPKIEQVEKETEDIEILDVSYEHEVPEYNPSESNSNVEMSDIYKDYYPVYKVDSKEPPFGNKEVFKQKYGSIIEKYCEDYGVDKETALSVFCHENGGEAITEEQIIEFRKKTNSYDGEVHAVGLTQISKANDGAVLKVYNRKTKQFDTIIIDIDRCVTDIEYSIKAGVMFLAHSIDYSLSHKNPNRTDEEQVLYGIVGYYAGEDGVEQLYKTDNSFVENCKIIKEKYGDYLNLALRTVSDGKGVTFTTPEGNKISFVIDNVSVATFDSSKDPNANPNAFIYNKDEIDSKTKTL